jgi:hypothetical protein
MAQVNLSCRLMSDYGVDGIFEDILDYRDGGLIASPFTVAYQAKASVNWEAEGEFIAYDLDARAYNSIATRPETASTLILILLCLPKDATKWHTIDPEKHHTVLEHCCYWHVFKTDGSHRDRSSDVIGAIIPNIALRLHAKTIASTRRSRRYDIVPLRMECVPLDIEGLHLCTADLDALRVAACIQFASHGEASSGRG